MFTGKIAEKMDMKAEFQPSQMLYLNYRQVRGEW